MKEPDFILRNSKNSFTKLKIFDDSKVGKVGCVFFLVIVSTLPHAEFEPNDHREYALHFIFEKSAFANLYFFFVNFDMAIVSLKCTWNRFEYASSFFSS